MTMENKKMEEPKLENILVVWKFPDAFLKELPRLLLEREIEFVIELIPRMEAMSKAPYRMALMELTELKVQLQKLFDKSFIVLVPPPGCTSTIREEERRFITSLHRL